jgi:cellulose 1,4-beta-cellobiosidase
VAVSGQGKGLAKPESHLPMPIQHCTTALGCAFLKTDAVLDANWRWTHKLGCTNSSECNCYLGNEWINATCTGVDECSKICGVDGEDVKGYKEKYGVSADGQGAMNITFVTNYDTEAGNGTNVGSRMFLLEDTTTYKTFKLLNKEFSFTVDGSKLPCGLNAAVYFVEMDPDGGMKNYPDNKAGAEYGVGYCDAQCPHDLKWIGGEANLINWNPSSEDPTGGTGKFGTCCAELDIWEANTVSTQMTVHACSTEGYHPCEGIECGDNPDHRFDGVCDKNGCDANPYRQGDHDFYGPGPAFTLDSLQPMTVVTQFITDDGTDTGKLTEMRRFYIQNNKTIYPPNPEYTPAGKNYTAISDEMCEFQMTNFSDRFDVFKAKGGIAGMGEAMARGMQLVLSLWDDHEVGMIWLDAKDPPPKEWPDPTVPPAGALRGTCNQTSGNYSFVEKYHADSYVVYSDIRYGEIGSTTGPSAPPPPPACPGGSKDACIALCDPTDPTKYLQCIQSCDQNCPHALGDKRRKYIHQ